MTDAQVNFVCPKCNGVLRAPHHMAGMPIKCPKCATEISVPVLFLDHPAPAPAAPALDPFAERLRARSSPAPAPGQGGSWSPGTAFIAKVAITALIAIIAVSAYRFILPGEMSAPARPARAGDATSTDVTQVALPPRPTAGSSNGAPAPGPTKPQLTADEEELANLRAERDRLYREAALRNEKAQLAREVDRLKGVPDPAVAQVTANAPDPELASMRAERDKLSREANLRLEKERLTRELERLKDPAYIPANATTAAWPAAAPKNIAEVVALCAPSVAVVTARLQGGEGTGAGFLAFGPNLLITNFHVVSGSQSLTVSLPAARGQARIITSGRVLAADRDDDLALIEIIGNYRNLRPLELQDGVIPVGGEVVAIGNPGMGGQILDQSVSNGIVSALDRVVDRRHYLQTTAAINPGNSGGPLLDLQGKVIGVVSAKATQQENIGFAVQVATLRAFFNQRDGKYKVTGDFRIWESELPMMALKDGADVIHLEGAAADLYYDADTKMIVAAIPERNKIALINLEERKIETEIFTGTDPSIVRGGGAGQVWVCSVSSKNISLVNLKKRKVEKTYALQGVPLDFTISPGGLWYFDDTGMLRVVPLNGGAEQITTIHNVRSVCYNGTRNNNIWCGGADGYLYEIDGDKMAGLLTYRDKVNKEMQDFNRDLNRSAATMDQQNRLNAHIQELDQEVNKCIKKFNRAGVVNPFDFSTRLQTLMFDSKKGRIYFNCCAVDAKTPDRIIGAFKNPDQNQTRSGNQKLQSFYTKYPYFRQIRAVSPDGTLVSTGTHIFNTEDFTINQALPVPTPAIVFSPDSRMIWFSDVFNGQLVGYPVKDDEAPKDADQGGDKAAPAK